MSDHKRRKITADAPAGIAPNKEKSDEKMKQKKSKPFATAPSKPVSTPAKESSPEAKVTREPKKRELAAPINNKGEEAQQIVEEEEEEEELGEQIIKKSFKDLVRSTPLRTHMIQ